MVGKLFERPDRQRLDPDRHAPALLALIAFGIGPMILIDDPAAIGLPIRRACQPPHGLESADMHLGFLRDHAWVLLQVNVDAVPAPLLGSDRRSDESRVGKGGAGPSSAW